MTRIKAACWLAMTLLLAAPLAVAQSVYRCVDADGTVVYSQHTCGEDAEEQALNLRPRTAGENAVDYPTLEDLVAQGAVAGLRHARPLLLDAQRAAAACEVDTRESPNLDSAACQRMQRAHQFVFVYADFGQMITSGQIPYQPAQVADIDRLGRANRATVDAFNGLVGTIRPRLR